MGSIGKGRLIQDKRNSLWVARVSEEGSLQVSLGSDQGVIPVSGSVDANVTNASLNTNATIQNASLNTDATIVGPFDAYGRFSTADVSTEFYHTNEYDLGAELWHDSTAAGATIVAVPNSMRVELRAGATGARAIRTSRSFGRIRPGKTVRAYISFSFTSENQDIVNRRVGLFDKWTGFYVKEVNGETSLGYRTSIGGPTSDTTIAQANWNIAQPVIDFTNSQTLVLEVTWLGIVRWGFILNGSITWVHEYLQTDGGEGAQEGHYFDTFQLPITYEIEIDEVGSPSTTYELYQLGSALMNEASPEDKKGIPFVISKGVTELTGTQGQIFIRPKATMGSQANRSLLQDLLVMAQAHGGGSAGSGAFDVYYNPTPTGGAWVSVHANSAWEYNITASGFSGGRVIRRLYTGTGTNDRQVHQIGGEGDDLLGRLRAGGLDFFGGTQTVVGVVSTLLAGQLFAWLSLGWNEIR